MPSSPVRLWELLLPSTARSQSTPSLLGTTARLSPVGTLGSAPRSSAEPQHLQQNHALSMRFSAFPMTSQPVSLTDVCFPLTLWFSVPHRPLQPWLALLGRRGSSQFAM